MKLILVTAIMLLTVQFSFSQQQSNTHFFAQCLLNIEDQSVLTSLEEDLKLMPFVKVVRVDIPTKRLFLLTQNLEEISIESFKSWLGSHSESASCIQVGLHGTDVVQPYPFTNCTN